MKVTKHPDSIIDVAYVANGEYVRAEIKGVLDVASAREASRQARALGDERGVKRYLVIMQNVNDLFSTTDQYTYMSSMRERGFRLDERFALVFTTLNDKAMFTETVATNRGHTLRAFDSVPQAVKWLCEGENAQAALGS